MSGVLKPGCGCGCNDCPPGADGVDGAAGASAYDVWIAEGNVGTEQDFLDSLVGAEGADGADGIDGVPNPKDNFYDEVISTLEVSSGGLPAVYHFPVGYGTLTYTNNSGGSKDYMVQVSYDCEIQPDNSNSLYHSVDGAIIKTVSAVDSVEYENLGTHTITGSLYDGAGLIDIVDRTVSTPDVATDSGDPIDFRFGTVGVPINVSFFKKVTLLDTESISLKFKTIEAGTPSTLHKAQIFVLEID